MGKKMKGLESGTANVVTDANGDGSLAVSFENPMDYDDFAVALAANESDITAIPFVTSKTVNGFTVNVDAAAIISTEVINTSSPNVTFNDNTKEVLDCSGETVTFAEVGSTGDTITRATGGFSRYLTDGDEITIAGSTSNDGTYTIATVTNTVITMGTDDLVDETNTTTTVTFTPTVVLKASNIVRGSGDWETLFGVGDVITITGSDDNDGSYTITAVATVTMTFTLATDVMVQDTQTSGSVTFVTSDGIDIGWIAKQNKF